MTLSPWNLGGEGAPEGGGGGGGVILDEIFYERNDGFF